MQYIIIHGTFCQDIARNELLACLAVGSLGRVTAALEALLTAPRVLWVPLLAACSMLGHAGVCAAHHASPSVRRLEASWMRAATQDIDACLAVGLHAFALGLEGHLRDNTIALHIAHCSDCTLNSQLRTHGFLTPFLSLPCFAISGGSGTSSSQSSSPPSCSFASSYSPSSCKVTPGSSVAMRRWLPANKASPG